VIFALLALCFACGFFGAAIYINVAEHPARLQLSDKSALRHWAYSYDRAFVLQSTLAILSAGAGFAAAWLLNDWRWCVGATMMLANWPYTLLAVLPLNKRLKAMMASSRPEARELLKRWNFLHGFRSSLSFLAVLAYWWPILLNG
jgi:hypothetical protein